MVKVGARILRSQHGQVPLPLILDVGFANPNSYLHTKESSHYHHDQDNHHHHSEHLANDGFVSVSFQSDRPFNIEKFQNFLTDQMPHDVFRAKGILQFNGSSIRHIFQMTGKRCQMNTDKWSTKPSSQLVFIGRNLNADQIREQLTKCLA